MNKSIILRQNPRKYILILIFCLFVLFMGIVMSLGGKVNAMGILSIIFGIIGVFVSLRVIIFRPITLTIDDEGIFLNCYLKKIKNKILWSDIKKINKFTQEISDGRTLSKVNYLIIYLTDPLKYNLKKDEENLAGNIVEQVAVSLGGSLGADVTIPEQLLPRSVESLIELIKEYPVKIGN